MPEYQIPEKEQNGEPMMTVSVAKCPATATRVPAVDADARIVKPGVARANAAVSTDVPFGSGFEGYREELRDYTVLQQHVLFWDRDGDDVITPIDTYIGFRELGFNMLFSIIAVLIINLNFSLPTRLAHSWIPDPFFRIYVDGIHKAKHGSDSGVIDPEGRFVPQNFENLFSKYDKWSTGSLSLEELFSMMRGHRCAVDPFGWGAAIFEWGTTWLLIQKDGRVSKEDLRQVYDGSVFWRIRAERAKAKGWNKGFGLGGDGFWGSQKVGLLKI